MKSRIEEGLRLLAVLVAVTAFLPQVTAQETKKPVTYEEALEKYKAYSKWKPLGVRFSGWLSLARARDPRGLELLIKEYGSLGEPHEFERAALVTVVSQHVGEESAAFWKAWRTKNAKPEHAWLWYLAILFESRADPSVRWAVVGDASLPVELRQAALASFGPHVGAKGWDEAARTQLAAFVQKPPSKPTERALWLELWSNVFWSHEEALQPAHKEALRSLLPLVDDPSTSPRTRLLVARNLARALGRDDVGPEPLLWSGLLADTVTEETEIAYAKAKAAAKAGFCGIVDHGRTIAFVIDASDSMLQPLSQRELADFVPITGSSAPRAPSDDSSGASAQRAIDWSKVKHRFDGARELVKAGLRQLRPDQRFTVVLFGDQASYLGATEGFVAATKPNIEACCKQLDSIPVGEPAADRPYGTLKGDTNLHGGILLALRAGDPAKAKARKYAPRDFAKQDEKGADTIYVFSDGAPSADDFAELDDNPSGVFQDAETGARIKARGKGLYQGPFAYSRYVGPEVDRLDLFQQARIHAVGIGEADAKLLRSLVERTCGRCILVGKD